MEQFFEKALVEQCAPTLAGVKPANLFRIGGNLKLICGLIDQWDQKLQKKGIRVIALKECRRTSACMVYVYREEWLERILKDANNLAFLEKMGYQTDSGIGMLDLLSHRFCLEQDYPHEIGIFLGYPLEDVVGFIENRGWNYTCCGLWKSYGDPAAAEACFTRYRNCTSQYKRMYDLGISVIQLAVAA